MGHEYGTAAQAAAVFVQHTTRLFTFIYYHTFIFAGTLKSIAFFFIAVVYEYLSSMIITAAALSST